MSNKGLLLAASGQLSNSSTSTSLPVLLFMPSYIDVDDNVYYDVYYSKGGNSFSKVISSIFITTSVFYTNRLITSGGIKYTFLILPGSSGYYGYIKDSVPTIFNNSIPFSVSTSILPEVPDTSTTILSAYNSDTNQSIAVFNTSNTNSKTIYILQQDKFNSVVNLPNIIQGVAYGNGKYVAITGAVNGNGYINILKMYYSIDGITWNQTPGQYNIPTPGTIYGIDFTYQNGFFALVFYSSTENLQYIFSDPTIRLNLSSYPAITGSGWGSGDIFTNKGIINITSNIAYQYTTDGINWNNATIPSPLYENTGYAYSECGNNTQLFYFDVNNYYWTPYRFNPITLQKINIGNLTFNVGKNIMGPQFVILN